MYKVLLAALVAVALMAPALGAPAPDGSVAWPGTPPEHLEGCWVRAIYCWCNGYLQYCWFEHCIPGSVYCGYLCPTCSVYVKLTGRCGDPVPVSIGLIPH
jgi:hypothetical protein